MKIETLKQKHFDLIVVENDVLKVTLCDLGASIYSIEFDGKIMTQSNENVDDFLIENFYNGKTIGRVCNRLPGNKITVDGKEYEIENNEGPNTLHGGKNGVSAKIFDYKIDNLGEKTVVTFTYLSKDLESGFPGNMSFEVIYEIAGSDIKIIMNAISDKKTMCSLCNHAYYCMGEDENTHLELKMNSSRYLHPAPSDLLPVEIRPVDEVMDFRTHKEIGKDINANYLQESKSLGYDHYFYFDEVNPNINQIELQSKKYKMVIKTDFSGTQIYTDNWPNGIKCSNSNKPNHKGVAIEPSESQKDLHYLDANTKYSKFMLLTFIKR